MQSRQRVHHILITTLWNVAVLLLALVTPNITIAIGCLGSLASCNVFVFPGLVLVSLARRHYRARSYTSIQNEEVDGGNASSNGQAAVISSDSSSDNELKVSWYSLRNRWVQLAMTAYGIFIILLGLIMFVIILMQVYSDLMANEAGGVNAHAVCNSTAI